MRFVLVASLAALAACVDAPPLSARARAECAAGGIAPGSQGYADCYSRIYASMNAGQDQRIAVNRARALRMAQQPMIHNPYQSAGGVYVPQVSFPRTY